MSRFQVSNKPDRNGLFQIKDKRNECAYAPFFYSYKGAVTYCNWLEYNIERSDKKRYVDFVNLYNSGEISIKNIMNQLALTEREYKKLRKLAIQNGHLNVKAHDTSNSYNTVRDTKQVYATITGDYKVSKIVDGETINFGIYKNKQDADYVASRLKKCGWDVKKLPQIINDLKNLKH